MTMIAAAVAAGAAAGVGDTAKQVVRDAYTALKGLIVRRYGVVEDRIAGVESDPAEPSRRRLLAEQLGRAGAGADEQVRAAAAELLRVVAEHTPEAAATVGVGLIRTEAGGDIEVSDVTVRAGSAVVATDVTAGGSIRISGVRVGSPGEDPFDALG
ncbi:hypothetical protein [Nocardia sp. BMG111209]|uniref:hypothetical protein n=1 Tax=Nocardia sp. BMG111209 TaxID=1160137 RepID=UPI0012DFC997|nr:hypothetical protein [Nocardia sp. BMG111209]